MSSHLSPLDAWLTGQNSDSDANDTVWNPGFDAERRIVISSFGPYHQLFERPQGFIPRFFHRVYPLLIEEWDLTIKTKLYDGFCTLTTQLQIHFQPTIHYIERNRDALPDVSRQIRITYERVIKDIVNAELIYLKDGAWVNAGLMATERKIENLINETLLLKYIQCRTICELSAVFAELTDEENLDGRFTQESVYLNVMQRNFEFREKQAQELFRQEDELELLRLEHKQKQLEAINQDDLLQRQKQVLESESIKRQLEEQEAQRIEQHAIEMRLQVEKTNHERQLKEIELAAEIQYLKDRQALEQQLDLQRQLQQHEQEAHRIEQHATEMRLQVEKSNHERELKEIELAAEIQYQKDRQMLEQQLELNRQAKQLEQEVLRTEQHALEMRLQEEKANHERQLKEIELGVEIQYQKDKQLLEQKLDLQRQAQQLEHERIVKELQRDAEVKDFEQEHLQYLIETEQKQRLKQIELDAELKQQETSQRERQKNQEKLEAIKLAHEDRLHKMHLEAEIKEVALRAEATKSKDEHLRREIEWLVLDRQRAELTRSIRETSKVDDAKK